MWQQYFCCTSALHLMKSNNGIHITELLLPNQNKAEGKCTMFVFVWLFDSKRPINSLSVIEGRVFLG